MPPARIGDDLRGGAGKYQLQSKIWNPVKRSSAVLVDPGIYRGDGSFPLQFAASESSHFDFAVYSWQDTA